MSEAMINEILSALQTVAPEIDSDHLESARPLREQADLDSMDWMEFLAELQTRTGVQIPAREASRLRSLDDLSAYISPRMSNAV
jgi:acyl carrier protein